MPTNWSPPLELTLTDASGITTAQGFIVTYAVIRFPAPKAANDPAAYLGDDAGEAVCARHDRLQGSRKPAGGAAPAGDRQDAVRAGTKTDTIIVRATVKYNGADVAGTPVDYVIPVKKKP